MLKLATSATGSEASTASRKTLLTSSENPTLKDVLRGWHFVREGIARGGDRFWQKMYDGYWLPVTGENVGKPVTSFIAVIRRNKEGD